MERNLGKSLVESEGEKDACRRTGGERPQKRKAREIRKEGANSWDSSSAATQGGSGRKKGSDWDSGSDCQVTMVEPFDAAKGCDDWDSEDERPGNGSRGKPEDEPRPPLLDGSSDSLDFLVEELSDIEKSSLTEGSDETRGEEKRREKRTGEEDVLLVEDLEEFSRDEALRKERPGSLASASGSKAWSERSEDTPEDTTVWMIPKSERSQSADSASKPISSSDTELRIRTKKAKSSSDVRKAKNIRRPARFSRSDCLGLLEAQKERTPLPRCEGQSLYRKLEIAPKSAEKGISGGEGFDRTGIFFAEFECRRMTIDKDQPDEPSASSGGIFDREEVPSESGRAPAEGPPGGQEQTDDGSPEAPREDATEVGRAGPAAGVTMDVVSLPDMIGRNSFKERDEKGARRILGSARRKKETGEAGAEPQPESTAPNHARESWFLLDDSGHSHPVTLNEVTILLNGRSADAVLQEKKEHFIPNPPSADAAGSQKSLICMLTKESLQHLLLQEDVGGEDGKRATDLERKMENTLLCIQPGMNLTASVRIIPIDTETVHLWRRTRDTGSALSSEVDLQAFPSQDSVEATDRRPPNDPHSGSSPRRALAETSVAEQDETPAVASRQEQQSADCSRLLIETRMIVDVLTNNFGALQSRLDGEMSRRLALQNEINKLRQTLKNLGGKISDRTSRETIDELATFQTTMESSPSPSTSKFLNETEMKAESDIDRAPEDETKASNTEKPDGHSNIQLKASKNSAATQEEGGEILTCTAKEEEKEEGCAGITVNIYTMEEIPQGCVFLRAQDSNTLVQSNLMMIERKMERLQHENEVIKGQNHELRRKLKEISQELEKYLWTSSEPEPCVDEGKELETLRDQVCNLKLELDYLKRSARSQEEALEAENSLMREELTKTLFSLEEWRTAVAGVLREVNEAAGELYRTGISPEANFKPEVLDPKTTSDFLAHHVRQTTRCLLATKSRNLKPEKILRQEFPGDSEETTGSEQVMSGYSALIDECRKGQNSGEAEKRVMDDYFAVIMEKASLAEEIKILKAENEILCESQLEHYEKLKQTMIALKERKSEVTALESSRKLSEEEKSKMTNVLLLYEEEKRNAEMEKTVREERIQALMAEMEKKDVEIGGCNERLKAAATEMKNFEKSSRLKDELIKEFRTENDRLVTADGVKSNHIEMLKNDVRNLQMQVTHLESELTSTKLFLNQSQTEMSAYVTHLESIVSSTQESLEKSKQKLKESNQTVSRLKHENDVLDKEHQCDLKLYNKTKDELINLGNLLRKAEEEREKLRNDLKVVEESEKEKSEALELLAREYQKLVDGNESLREKADAFSREKDESLKEHKDLVNKYAMASREVQRLQERYRRVKAECNERTDLIRYMEAMMKENLLEYNNRIACLENNVSRLIEKIMACKDCVRETRHGVDAEVRQLRHQLDATYQERKELEDVVDNYYSLMNHLKSEIREREKQVDELHARLSSEQQRPAGQEVPRKSLQDSSGTPRKTSECSNVEKLKTQLTKTKNELSDCRKELHQCRSDYEKDTKKLELTIADLKSDINRYQLRIEVLMKNLYNCSKNKKDLNMEKRNAENEIMESRKKELEEKNKTIAELNESINRYKTELTMKESDLDSFKTKSFILDQELKALRETLSAKINVNEARQKEKDEMAEKLLESIKLIMEERSARQACEILAVEKEKNLKNRIEQIKREMVVKVKECEALSCELQVKNKVVNQLQDDCGKMKSEVASLRTQVSTLKKKIQNEGLDKQQVHNSLPLTNLPQNTSTQRLESCLKELKTARDVNIQLRKLEGQCEAKIVSLENELRDARLLIKELQGDIKTEKKSKKIFKNMIIMTKMEIEKCLLAKQLMSNIAERISRHLHLSEIPSRELLSGFRLNETQCTQKTSIA